MKNLRQQPRRRLTQAGKPGRDTGMETRRRAMSINHADSFKGRPARAVGSATMLLIAGMLLQGNHASAQNAPFVVSAQTTLASYTVPPPVNGNPLLQGAGFGTLAV